MEAFFEDSKTPKYASTLKHPFDSFINGTKHNGGPIEPHWHYYFEILYVVKGQGKLINNGHILMMNEGDLFYVYPRDVHSIIYSDSEFEYIVVKFDPDMLFDSPRESLILKNIIPVIQPISPLLKKIDYKSVDDSIIQSIIEIYKVFTARDYGFEFLVKSHILKCYFYFITYLKIKGVTISFDEINNDSISPILPAYEYIHHHFKENITAKELADYCHLSYSYFSRQFKKISGVTFTQYLNFMRINEGEKLLLENKLSVTEIAYHVGFTDTSYFIKQFKTYKSMTPKQFISKLQNMY